MADYVMVDQEEVSRLGLASTLVDADDLAIAREQHKAKQATTAADADAVIFEDGPQPVQDDQEQASDAAEVAEAPTAVEGPKQGRRGR